jgi:P-type Cu+ transporter
MRVGVIGEDLMSETVKDPVCGMTVDPDEKPELHVDYKGQTYFFCGKGCLLDFKDEPEAYLDPNYEPHGM